MIVDKPLWTRACICLLATTSLLACSDSSSISVAQVESGAEPEAIVERVAIDAGNHSAATIDLAKWHSIQTPPLDPQIEDRIDKLLPRLTLEQKVGQVIQADSNAVTPEQVKRYRLGSVLSGGNSAPGPNSYADVDTWLRAADEYFLASVDSEGVEVAIPMIWGIDAVHGHTNLIGAVAFPHNIGLGAANNPDLIEQIYQVTARQLRVSGHDWTFAPTLAVPQNDRWGRTYEGYSENPEIVASYGDRIVYGLQGRIQDPDYLGSTSVLSTAKHYVGDGGTEGGIDQGDAKISEDELRDVHMAGYRTAIAANVRSVMASFSAWNGVRMHGHKGLLTDVLKDRMGFTGFVVGDWNGHGLIPGCSATDCPQSLIAGLDMYMAPESWEGLWHSTLKHVKSGRIPMERLDDAVRRILRVKIELGLLNQPLKPSARPLAGDKELLGSDAHRQLARRAVRQSLVLLKNNDGLLPLDPSKTYLLVGDGADSVAKMAGGWTLSWQGGEANSEFPNAQTIRQSLSDLVAEGGGRLIYDPDGTRPEMADVVIAVYGEDPYAEFQGDLPDVDFKPQGFDTTRLKSYQQRGLKTVSVFLSGRPLWTNPEINGSDAFVAAWLPGTEGGGITDMLFRVDDAFEFTGRLPFSWPKRPDQARLNAHHENYDPLFPMGYGLNYGDQRTIVELSELGEHSGSSNAKTIAIFHQGALGTSFSFGASGGSSHLPHRSDETLVQAFDKDAQESALRVKFLVDQAQFNISSDVAIDLLSQVDVASQLNFEVRALSSEPLELQVGLGCESCVLWPVTANAQWHRVSVAMNCFTKERDHLASVSPVLTLVANAGSEIALANVNFAPADDQAHYCN